MRALLAVVGIVVLVPAAASAQQTSAQQANAQQASAKLPRPDTAAAEPEFSFGQMTPTADMWLYEQEVKRYSEPKAAVRRRAEFEADQRQARLAAQRWFGFSVSRPTVSTTPFTGTYSPMWTSNSPYGGQWRAVNPATIMVPVAPVRSTTGYGLW